MKRIYLEASWPISWKLSYDYDLQEIYGEISCRGYTYAYENRRFQTLRLLTEVVSPGARILDIGAGQGNFSLLLAEMGYRVTWNDFREELAGYVSLKHEKGELAFAPGNVFDLKFDTLFDTILVTEIIEHVAHPDDFLCQVAQLVKPGGHVILTTPNGAYFQNDLSRFSDCLDANVYEAIQFKPSSDGHIFLLYPEEILVLAQKAALQVEKLMLFTNPLTTGYLGTESLLNLLPKSAVGLLEAGSQCLPSFLARRFLFHMAVRFRKEAVLPVMSEL